MGFLSGPPKVKLPEEPPPPNPTKKPVDRYNGSMVGKGFKQFLLAGDDGLVSKYRQRNLIK